MSELRVRLFEITENRQPHTHRNLIERLAEEFPHTIRVIEGQAPIERYTCAMHAFGLIENDEYIRIVQAAPPYIFASPSFIQRLVLKSRLTELPNPQPGALIVYSEFGCAKHAGKMLAADHVESKWGVGHLYHHGVLEVSGNYGSELRSFEAIDTDFALDEFAEYAREHGVRLEGDA